MPIHLIFQHCALARIFALAAVLAPLLLPAPAWALSRVPLSLEESVQVSDAVFVGRVVARNSFWADDSKKWMWTDVTLKVEDGISGTTTGETVTVRYWGGQIGDEAMVIGGMPLPVRDARYVMLLKPASPEPRFSPIVGEVDGLFHVNGPAQSRIVTNAEGGPVALPEVAGRAAAEASTESGPLPLAEFTTWLRENIKPIRARPLPRKLMTSPIQERVYPGQPVPASGGSAALPGTVVGPLAEIGSSTVPTVPDGVPDSEPAIPVSSPPSPASGVKPLYFRKSYAAALPIVFNQLPPAMAPWSGVDQAQMTKWNYYADVFRVSSSPTGTFAWKNDRFDMCGFPSSSTMQSVYGAPWGATTLGICHARYNTTTNVLLEADIALNPAFTWSLDEEWIHNGGGTAYSFRATVLHELGHAWGLGHQFWDYSVMNYVPRVYEPIVTLPFMDDAEAIRAHYPDALSNRIDLGVALVSLGTPNAAGEYQGWTDATFPNSVRAARSFDVSNFRMENSGTIARDVILEWYLSKNRNFDGDYRHLRTVNYGSLARYRAFGPTTTNLPVPSDIAEGTYYLGAYIRSDGGPTQGFFPRSNNEAFSRKTVVVSQIIDRVSPSSMTVKPGTSVTVRPYLKGPSGGSYVKTFINGGSTAISVAASVYIPSGATSAPVTVHIAPRDLPTSAILFFSYGDDSKAITFNIVPDFTMQDVRKALQTAAGLRSSTYAERQFWNVVQTGDSANVVGVEDAVAILRRVTGAGS